ncbi:elongation factor P (EF-P) family protein [Citrus sinensis]|uniref:Elongation factor P (EF-P) family protein n=1 Tax=Citrus sinensis TaxID=2711 RepID=A0ACB8JWK0_CITSI|nr:elongation factor P (EF-P) family protein [Citrus sinensis]
MAGTATTVNLSSAPYLLRRSSFTTLSSKPSALPMRPRIYAFSSNDIKVGSNIEVDGAPWRVLEFLHVKPGKGAAFVRTKLRNYMSGTTVERTFRAGITTTFEEVRLNETDVGDKKKWLKEGMDCNLLFWKGKIIDFEVPITVQLTVVDVDPGLKGDTASGIVILLLYEILDCLSFWYSWGSKPATLDTGAVVNVPLFVNIGDEILVDTRTGQYMTRA